MARFMQDGRYSFWSSEESLAGRLGDLDPVDQRKVDLEENLVTRATDEAQTLNKRRRQLKTFLSQVAKVVSENNYSTVMRQATSLNWIYTEIRKDYDIQQKGVHFFNILEVVYDSSTMTPVGFNNQYRSLVMNNMARNGDRIRWKGTTLQEDEKLSPTFEDMILLNVVGMLDQRLPAYIKTHYALQMEDKHVMDSKTDFFTNVNKFIQAIEGQEELNALRADTVNLSGLAGAAHQPSPKATTQAVAVAPSRSRRSRTRTSRGRSARHVGTTRRDTQPTTRTRRVTGGVPPRPS